jgi:shikimate dehydrogenase
MNKRYKLGVLGNTLSHSKSPDIQIAGLEYLGLEGSYGKYEIDPDNFNKEINQLLSELDGLNVTIPYKEKILKYLNKKDVLVTRIGATNTLTMTSLGIYGYNTDHYGFTESIKEINLKNKTAAIIGSGGASKAIIVALNDLGVSKIKVLVRNLDKAELNIPKTTTEIELKLNTEELELNDTDILINCTPIGQGRLRDDMPITISQLKSLNKGSYVYDLIYNETLLLKNAAELGLRTFNGSEMLILQGVKSLSIWTGADITEGLKNAMREAFHC